MTRGFRRRRALPSSIGGVALVLVIALSAGPADAVPLVSCSDPEGGFCALEYSLEMTSLNLSGGPFALPLASDPGNALGDSVDGFGFVNSDVTITLSSQRPESPGPASPGWATAVRGGAPAIGPSRIEPIDGGDPPPVDPAALHGRRFFVDSFFDVYFDIGITDVDPRPGRDYAGQPDGASFVAQDLGPGTLESRYDAVFEKDAPGFGLVLGPEEAPYVAGAIVELPLGIDINGNGENDIVKFTFAVQSFDEDERTSLTLPDGTVVFAFDSGFVLEGLVVDESTDPPFMIGGYFFATEFGMPDPATFGCPTMVNSRLRDEVLPEPSSLSLFGVALAVFAAARRRVVRSR